MKMKKVKRQKRARTETLTNPDYSRLEMDMILARLALPMEKRTGFLRRRLPNGGSCL